MPSVIRGDDNFDSGGDFGPPTTTGGVGTYAFLGAAGTNQTFTQGNTYAGSVLRYAGVTRINNGWDNTGSSVLYNAGGGSTPSGTWRAMGYAPAATTIRWPATVMIRIA